MSDFENGNGESGDKSNGIKDIPERTFAGRRFRENS